MQPKVSPLAQNSTNGNNSSAVQSAPQTPQTPQTPQSGSIPPPPPPPSMGSLAMGMPFQVFPTGPAVKNNNQQLSTPQTNGNNRKSPKSFEPPPMGCRPEIKIPANPMALLKSAPRPQPKSDYWIQDYVQEKGRDSTPSEDEVRQQFASSPVIQQQQRQYSSMPSPPPAPQKQQSPIRYAQRSPSPPEHRDFSGPVRNVKLEDLRTASPVQVNRSSPVMSPSPSLPSPMTPMKNVTMEPLQTYNQPQSYQQPQQVYQQPQQNYQPTQQNYQQPTQGARIILSTMPNKQHLQAQQHVSFH